MVNVWGRLKGDSLSIVSIILDYKKQNEFFSNQTDINQIFSSIMVKLTYMLDYMDVVVENFQGQIKNSVQDKEYFEKCEDVLSGNLPLATFKDLYKNKNTTLDNYFTKFKEEVLWKEKNKEVLKQISALKEIYNEARIEGVNNLKLLEKKVAILEEVQDKIEAWENIRRPKRKRDQSKLTGKY